MLRLHRYQYHQPCTVAAAAALLDEFAGDAMPIAGGTDLVPNMKHRLFTPGHVVSLNRIEALRGIGWVDGPADGGPDGAARTGLEGGPDGAAGPGLDRRLCGGSARRLRIGALETLADVAAHPIVRTEFAALGQAAALVAGPQHRNVGTIGGNVCLDTRCTYYNQTEFWRGALGHCLKKDGDVCHVTKVGRKCVAAHSADTPSALIALDAVLTLEGPDGARNVPAETFFVADGISNTVRDPSEIVTQVRLPLGGGGRDLGPDPVGAGTDMAGMRGNGLRAEGWRASGGGAVRRLSVYRKLRQRRSIDFPLLSVAVACEVGEDRAVRRIRGVVSALGARPRVLSGWEAIAVGERLERRVIDALAERAHAQCRPLENMIVDAEWRRAMVKVEVRRALEGLAEDASNTHEGLAQDA